MDMNKHPVQSRLSLFTCLMDELHRPNSQYWDFFCISTLTKILFTVYIWDFYQTWGSKTRSMNTILTYSCCNSQFRVHDVPDIFHRRKIWSAGRAVGAECPAVCWLLAVSKCTSANDGPSTIITIIMSYLYSLLITAWSFLFLRSMNPMSIF